MLMWNANKPGLSFYFIVSGKESKQTGIILAQKVHYVTEL